MPAMLLVVAFVAVGAWLTGFAQLRDLVIGDIKKRQFLPDARAVWSGSVVLERACGSNNWRRNC